MLRSIIIALCIFSITACAPMAIFNPKAIKSASLASLTEVVPKNNVRITVDAMGVPFIKALTIDDVIYGLGFMHARDRLFQLDLLRHASLGKLSELFGERTLSFDKKLRILTYRLDEQMAKLTDAENHLLENYVKGVNDGAQQRGRTAEHFLIGADFKEFTKRDVIAIARIQSWQLASDLTAEFTRLRIAKSPLSDAAKEEIIAGVDDRGSAIISNKDPLAEKFKWPSYLAKASSPTALFSPREELVQMSGGASNAWAINGRLAQDGHAMLMNDPHLQHNWPSNFYLVSLQADDLSVTGATFPGLPGVVIGANKNLAWGVTASFLNTQDAVFLQMVSGDDHHYFVDGKKLALTEWPQRFCTNKKDQCTDETFFVSIFGPVVDHDYDSFIGKNDRFAVQWTGFAIDEHKDPNTSFIKLAQAHDVHEAAKIIDGMTLPGVNIVFADHKGNNAYAYAGLVPQRDGTQNSYLPLDSAFSSSKWSKFSRLKPSSINPTDGYIVTANQNIFSRNAQADLNYGKIGAPPYRALRIKERIEEMIKTDTLMDFEKLSQVQLDATSTEAKELAPLIGAICVENFRDKDGYRQSFARAVQSFDGHYSKESREALPYEMLMAEIVAERVKTIFGSDLQDDMGHLNQTRFAIKNALHKALTKKATAIFAADGQNGDAKSVVRDACEDGYQALIKRASKSQWAWRWGRHHYLKRRGAIAGVPFIGGFFRDKKREVAGAKDAPMAETGLPVKYGANLRFRAKLSDPPEIFAVLDAGNSGSLGEKNSYDQALLWHEGKALRMELDWTFAMEKSVSYFELDRSEKAATKK